MAGVIDLRIKMYLTLIVIFAIGFGIIYAILFLLGAGLMVVIPVAALFFLLQWYISPAILKAAAHLHYLEKDEHPDLQKIVQEIVKEADVPMPKIAIAPNKDPNAYVFGRTRKSATLVVHEGLIPLLSHNEMRAVLSHEIGHLKHNDVVVMTVVSFIPVLAYIIAQSMFFSGMFGGMGNSRNNSGAVAIIVGILAFAVYFIAQLFILSLSRTRESYADDYSAESTRHPEYLATSLIKITSDNVNTQPSTQASSTARSFYIVDFFGADRDVKELEEHAEEIRGLLPGVDVYKLIERAKGTKRSAWHSMNSVFATHPSAYRRILDLAEISKESGMRSH
jgi:heat shock protein HtpX